MSASRGKHECVNCHVWLDYGWGLCGECLRVFLVGLAAGAAAYLLERL